MMGQAFGFAPFASRGLPAYDPSMHSQPALEGNSGESVRLPRVVLLMLACYLLLVWFGGGPTVDVTSLDEWLMLLALAPVVLGTAALTARATHPPLIRLAMLAAVLLPAIPLTQLLVLPAWVGGWSSVRTDLAADLRVSGITSGPQAWTLWPETTTRALLALLPALGCFLCALSLGKTQRRTLALLVLGLVLANLVFGLFQVGLPATSSLRLYSNNGSGIGGVLVNSNHQGTALIVGMLLGFGLWSQERRQHRQRVQPLGLKSAAYATASFACLAAVPLTDSSGAMLIAVIAFGAGVFATGLLSLRRIRSNRVGVVAAIGVVAVLALGLLSAQRWMYLRGTDAMRYDLAREVTAIGVRHAPFGSGVGTFVDSFAQSASPQFQRGEYINHAHNEFAQWWFEAGWPGLALLAFALTLLGVAGWRLLRARREPVAIGCWLAVVSMLAHSWVDFPLRTLSLMSIGGLLAGMSLAAASRPANRSQAAHDFAMP